MSIGDKIKSLREDRSYSQYQLAEILSVSPGTLSKYENGKMQIPLDIIVKVANVFDVSADYILDRTAFAFDYSVLEGYYVGGIKTEALINDIVSLNKNNRTVLSELVVALKLKNSAESIKSKKKVI